MKKYRKLLLTSFAVYIVLLILLVAAEGGRPDASIQSFWDAIWFSIITLTTVGYGDLSPVTPFGRVVGLIFAFCSVGILASLIGIGLNLLSGTIIPRFRLRFGRRQLWYAFSEENEDTAALAEALARQDRNCLLIFPRDNAILSGPNVVRMVFDPDSLARIRRSKDGLSLFFVGAEPWDNYTQALDAAEKGIRSFCMADIRAEKLPPLMHLFSPMEVMSRSYWKEHPLRAAGARAADQHFCPRPGDRVPCLRRYGGICRPASGARFRALRRPRRLGPPHIPQRKLDGSPGTSGESGPHPPLHGRG